MADIVDDLADLHRQATHEPSHYYAAKTAERAIREIERLRAVLKGIGGYVSSDGKPIGAIDRLIAIRNTAQRALEKKSDT